MPAPYHPRVRWLLETRGIPPRLLQALETEPILTFPDVPQGAGMVGATGSGKSFAMVRHLAEKAQKIMAAAVTRPNAGLWPSPGPVWASWVQKAGELNRAKAAGDYEAVEAFVERAKATRWLYLDDLGRESLSGSCDYALGILQEIIDFRYANMRPVFWTTNLEVFQLGEFYRDQALVERMVEAWPPVKVMSANLRMSPPMVSA